MLEQPLFRSTLDSIRLGGQQLFLRGAPPAVWRNPESYIEILEEMTQEERADAELMQTLERQAVQMPPNWRRCQAKRPFGLTSVGGGCNYMPGQVFYWNVATGVSTRQHPCLGDRTLQAASDSWSLRTDA